MENVVTTYLIRNQVLFTWRQANIHRQPNRWKKIKRKKASNTEKTLVFYPRLQQLWIPLLRFNQVVSELGANLHPGSGCEMHTLGKLMLLSHVLVQLLPLMEKHKLALLWGLHPRKPSNSSRFREIFYLSIHCGMKYSWQWFSRRGITPSLLDKLNLNLIHELARNPQIHNLSSSLFLV